MKIINIKKIRFDLLLLNVVFALQFAVWFFISQDVKPDFTITPLPPTRMEMDIASLGDSEFAYRMYGQLLQNAGDTFGETIPLQDYDFKKLEKWFYALDDLNRDAQYIPSIASFYYGQSQNVKDCEYVIRYLVNHADFDPSKQWRWYMQSVYLAGFRMKDYDLAKSIAEKLIAIKDNSVPFWTKTMVPFMIQKNGDICDAYDLVMKISESDMRSIVTDPIMSAKDGSYNFASKMLVDKVDALKKDPLTIAKCRNRKKIEK